VDLDAGRSMATLVQYSWKRAGPTTSFTLGFGHKDSQNSFKFYSLSSYSFSIALWRNDYYFIVKIEDVGFQ
jgi:hypothetical protein